MSREDVKPDPDAPSASGGDPTDGPEPKPATTGSDDEADTITFERIRERAYELWERNHRPEGFEIQFWLLAERELRAERDRRRAGTRAEDES